MDRSTGQPAQHVDRRRQSDIEEEILQASPTRYFIVKPSPDSLTALEADMSHTSGVWSFPTTTERKLMSAVSSRPVVVIIFSMTRSLAFQGSLLASQEVSFTNTQVSHIINKMDDGRRLQTARDGQEAGISLLQAMVVTSGLGGQQGRGRRDASYSIFSHSPLNRSPHPFC